MAYIITLSGMLGSGKSTIGKLLAQKLAYTFYSTGIAQRQIAKTYGVTTLELNKMCITDPSIDMQIDSVFKTLSQKNQNFVVDSRMAFFFIPNSFKVKLNVDTNIAGERIFNDTERTEEKSYTTIQESIASLKSRRILEVERFKRIYHVDIDDNTNFDFIIDTTYQTPETICTQIITKFHEFIQKKQSNVSI